MNFNFCELEKRELKDEFPAFAPASWGFDPFWLFQHPAIALIVYLMDKAYYFPY